MMKSNSFAMTQVLMEAKAVLRLEQDIYDLLSEPMNEFSVTIPVRMDDGIIRFFKGHRVQYSNLRGPFIGGLRLHPEETIDSCRERAACVTLRTAVLNLPLGGASGSISCDPKHMSRGELQRLVKAYVQGIRPIIGEHRDIISSGGDVDEQMVASISQEYNRLIGYNVPGIATGKSPQRGGSWGHKDAVARGGLYCVREAAKSLGLNLNGATAVIQGYGRTHVTLHRLASELLGLKVIAVSDELGGIHNPHGLDYKDVEAHLLRNGRIQAYEGADAVSNAELIDLDTDVFFLTALENQITSPDAAKIQTKLIAEMTTNPIDSEAEEILLERDVCIIPNLLCAGGSIIIDYLENVQNRSNLYWDKATVNGWLEKTMIQAFRDVSEMARLKQVRFRLAVFLTAVQRLNDFRYGQSWV